MFFCFREAKTSLLVQDQMKLKKKSCVKCKKKVVNMKRHVLHCANNESEGREIISAMCKKRQNLKSLNRIDSYCCKICKGFYQFPRSHLKKIHSNTEGLWKNYFIELRLTKKDLDSEFEKNLHNFGNDYLLNPQFSSLDLASNANEKRSMKQYKNKARELLIFAAKNESPTDINIVKGTSYLCEAFPRDQYEKNFKAGSTKSKLTAFQHYLQYVDFKVKMDKSQVREKDLELALKLVKNTIKSLKGRVKMRDSEVAVQRSKFFWSTDHEAQWKEDPKTLEAENLLTNPLQVGQDKSKFTLARNHLQIKIAKTNGKRNLEIAMLEISQTLEPDCVIRVNEEGDLQYVIYNTQFKNKKAGGISKLTLDQSLMTQLLDFISIIRPNFKTMASKDRVFITQHGHPISENSVSKTWQQFQRFYDGQGLTSNMNFRQQFGRIANEFGTDLQRRHTMDQQDHSEATCSRYYEQNPQTSISAVRQNQQFQEEASRKDAQIKVARKNKDGQIIKDRMDSIKKGTHNK